MKKIILSLIVLLMLGATPALALPTLQLDIQDGVHVGGDDETVYATADQFTLFALLNDPNPSLLNNTFYISAAITPDPGTAGGDYGYFIFDGKTVAATSDMTYGTPPIDESLKDLQGHGIYDTWYQVFALNFDSSKKAAKYNSQDDPGGLVVDPLGSLYYQDFVVDVSGLASDLSVHFDLYVVDDEGNIIDKAPFSHDAQSAPVPEPASMLLLGTGLIGIAGLGRKKIKAARS